MKKQVSIGIVTILATFSLLYGDVSIYQEPDREPGWIVVRLDRTLDGRRADDTFPVETGRSELDSAILKHGIHRIGYARLRWPI